MSVAVHCGVAGRPGAPRVESGYWRFLEFWDGEGASLVPVGLEEALLRFVGKIQGP